MKTIENEHQRTPRCPFAWFGGKGSPRIRNAVLAALPQHEKYIEPFGGGASILLGKEPATVEVYNDVNRGLVNFFRVIGDPENFAKFIAKVSGMAVSRVLFEECARTWPAIHDPVEQAARWFYAQRNSFSGTGTAFAVSQTSSGGVGSTIASFKSALEALPSVHERMQRTVIECVDWREALRLYEGMEWLAYCDPPYVMGARKSGGYAHELDNKDHEELIERLIAYRGAVVLSGYDSSIYAPLKKAGWEMRTIDVVCTAAGRTRVSGLQGKGNVSQKQRRTECIWRNPRAVTNSNT